MADTLILWPAVAMVALTFVVWWLMFFERVAAMRRGRIAPHAVATSTQVAARLPDCRRADNFRNLFELPVLFYAALGVAFATGQVEPAVLGLAWAFVVLRVVHSAIQCSYNRVMHRFYVYLTGGLVLFGLWGRLAWGLL